jgi:hypothetical protein
MMLLSARLRLQSGDGLGLDDGDFQRAIVHGVGGGVEAIAQRGPFRRDHAGGAVGWAERSEAHAERRSDWTWALRVAPLPTLRSTRLFERHGHPGVLVLDRLKSGRF